MKDTNIIKILVAEDSPTQAMVLKYILEKHDYEVTVAKDGKEALDFVHEHKPSLVISDIIMPEMNGYKLCKNLKSNENTSDIPVILLTSLSRAEDVLDGLECGADNFLTKPYAEDYLNTTIELILANKKLQKSESETVGVEIIIAGKRRTIKATQQQMLTLLLSTYEAASQRNTELVKAQDELKQTNERLEEIVSERTAELSSEIETRKVAEKILESQHALLSSLINSSKDTIIFSLDKNYCYTTFNEKHRAEMKQVWNADIKTGSSLLDYMNVTELRELARKSIDRALNGEFFIEIQHQSNLGIYYEFSWNPIIQNKEAVGVTVFIRDITLRKQDEETLRRRTERLRNLHKLDQAILQAIESPEAIIQTALQHLWVLLHCERASVGIIDKVKKDLQVFASDVNGQTIVQVTKHLSENAFAEMENLRQGQVEIVENTGSLTSCSSITRIMQVNGIQSFINVPLISAQGRYGMLNISWENPRTVTQEETDIAVEVASQITIAIEQANLVKETRLYASDLEKRVSERTAQLEASNKEMETFSYSISHDLRAPLRHISGFISLFLENKSSQLDDKDLGYLSVASKSAEDMGLLIDGLLSFSRLNRGELNKTHVETLELINQGFKLFDEEIQARSVEIKIGPLAETYGDIQLMGQVWINLISNAVKYTGKKDKATIEIGSYSENNETIFFIKDNGAGFNMEYADKLFNVFHRLHQASDFEGIGIGLANIHRIITRHGGRCWAEGETDQGATFYFSLPRKESA